VIIEIIPNLHPLFVHFTVALIATSAALFIFSRLFATKYQNELSITAKWCLWLSGFTTVATVSAGFYAYYTVGHDSPSHLVMKLHRNLALVSCLLIFTSIGFSLFSPSKLRFYTFIILSALMVSVTAWYGGELVYRHGIGVISLPNTSEGHEHDGNSSHGHEKVNSKENISPNALESKSSNHHTQDEHHEMMKEGNVLESSTDEKMDANEEYNHSAKKSHGNHEGSSSPSYSQEVLNYSDEKNTVLNGDDSKKSIEPQPSHNTNKDGHDHEH
jgi:uncharacterized membrane protein